VRPRKGESHATEDLKERDGGSISGETFGHKRGRGKAYVIEPRPLEKKKLEKSFTQ